jgi:protocatechuate 3,4-dioxygenase beta subunit
MRVVAFVASFLLVATAGRAQCVFAPEYLSYLGAVAHDAPSSIVVAGPGEPGERLVVTGRAMDGTKPVVGAAVYVFHTDIEGLYARGKDNRDPEAELHPRLHGALRTDAKGEYRYETIRPGSYLGIAAHVHYVVVAPGYQPRLFDLQFQDDPILVARREAGEPEVPQSIRNSRCFKAEPDLIAIRPVRRDADGVWHTVRDLDMVPE